MPAGARGAHGRQDGVPSRLCEHGARLAKIVRMEADIRTAQTELDDVGMMVENKRGTPIPNPLLSVIDTLERRQLAVIRSMFLNETTSDLRTTFYF